MTRKRFLPVARSVLAALLFGAAIPAPGFAQVVQRHDEVHRPGGGVDKPSIGKPPAKIGLPASVGSHQLRIPGAPAAGRNAIGVSVTPPNPSQRTGIKSHPPMQLPPVTPGSTGRLANPTNGPIANPPESALRGEGINGSSVTRPGVTPTVLGGPVKPVTGINGTSFRHKQ